MEGKCAHKSHILWVPLIKIISRLEGKLTFKLRDPWKESDDLISKQKMLSICVRPLKILHVHNEVSHIKTNVLTFLQRIVVLVKATLV